MKLVTVIKMCLNRS